MYYKLERFFILSLMATILTHKSTNTNLSSLIFGNFMKLMIFCVVIFFSLFFRFSFAI